MADLVFSILAWISAAYFIISMVVLTVHRRSWKRNIVEPTDLIMAKMKRAVQLDDDDEFNELKLEFNRLMTEARKHTDSMSGCSNPGKWLDILFPAKEIGD